MESRAAHALSPLHLQADDASQRAGCRLEPQSWRDVLPLGVQLTLQWLVAGLRAHDSALQGVRRARGNGHFLSLEWHDRRHDVLRLCAKLRLYVARGERLGLKWAVEACVEHHGGVPEFDTYWLPDLEGEDPCRLADLLRHASVLRQALEGLGALPLAPAARERVRLAAGPSPLAGLLRQRFGLGVEVAARIAAQAKRERLSGHADTHEQIQALAALPSLARAMADAH